jgi:predicted CopG family antitoxin
VGYASTTPLPEDSDPLAPQREAAMFYGLFLRGHSAESLRRDIEIPRQVVDKLMKRKSEEPSFRKSLQRVYHYRRKVLAIFDELVLNERTRLRLQ